MACSPVRERPRLTALPLLTALPPLTAFPSDAFRSRPLTGGPAVAVQSGLGFAALAYFLDRQRRPKAAHAATLHGDGTDLPEARSAGLRCGARPLMQQAISQVDGLPSPAQHPLGTRDAKTMAHQTEPVPALTGLLHCTPSARLSCFSLLLLSTACRLFEL